MLQGDTYQWLSWIGYALWADRVTVKRNMGYSPYFLLYGQHPLLLFDIMDATFHVLDWPNVSSTTELLALRMQQLNQRNDLLVEACEKNFCLCIKLVAVYNEWHSHRMN